MYSHKQDQKMKKTRNNGYWEYSKYTLTNKAPCKSPIKISSAYHRKKITSTYSLVCLCLYNHKHLSKGGDHCMIFDVGMDWC